MAVLVTGGTGTLGREVVPLLRARDIETHVLSRNGHPAFRHADLETGVGLTAALDGVDTIVHLAAGRSQQQETRNLLAAARSAGIRHLVFISIAGVDRIPFPYYVQKLAAETEVVDSGIPFSMLRTTQFHDFAAAPFLAQRLWPVLLAPKLSIQPIDTRTVARHLVDLALGEPSGRMPELGGPQVLTGRRIAAQVQSQLGWAKRIVDVGLFGRTWAAFAAGYHLVPGNRAGGRTFAEYLAAR